VSRPRGPVRTPFPSEVVSIQEAAERLDVHRSTAYDLVAKGKFPLPVIRVGNQLKVSRAQLEHFIRTGELLDPQQNGST